jgi:transcriptional regulator with XRE-family HTH domain
MEECTPLEMAVKYLKERGVIDKDADIADTLDISRGTLSAYISGTTKPSKPFIKKFENYYKLKLADFANNMSRSNNNNVVEAKNEIIIELLKKEVARLQFQVDINFAAALETLQEIYAKVSENQRLLNVLMGSDLGGEEDLDVRPYKKPNKDQKKKGNPN